MSNSAIQIKTERPRIEELLAPYRGVIGDDYAGYRNHVLRTVTYAMHFLDGDLDVEPTVETAMARLGRDMAASLSVADPNDVRRMALAINDVTDVAAFGQLLRFLERQPLVQQVDVLAMDNAMASLELAYIGGEAQVVQLLDSFAGLEPVANPGFMVGGTVPLDEGLTPPRVYRLRR